MLASNLDEASVAPLIEGVLAESTSQARIEVKNPSNGRVILTIPEGADVDVDRAVGSSRRAADDGRWSDLPPSMKKKILHRFADLIQAESAALDALDAEEMGKPIREAFCNAAAAAGLMRFCAEAVDKVRGEVNSSDKNSFVVQRRVPRGVVAAVVPWNFPTFNAVLKVAPALAAGNCVVLKPSELSSRSALRLAHLALRAELPPGVLNVIPGLGHIVGRALGLHHEVNMLTFTGSTAVGKQMLQYAGQSNMKVVMAECGGKSPQIVFDDGVDLEGAAKSIANILVINQGQLCSVGSRLLVQRSIANTLLDGISTHVRQIVMGDARDSKTTFGPLVTQQQCARVVDYIETAQADGARLVSGGHRGLIDTGGAFVEPTIFSDVVPQSRLSQDEIFGPVLAATSFDDEAEAIRIANGTRYGLVAYVWTASLSTGMRMAKGLRSAVLVNSEAPAGEGPGHAFSSEPFGQSGVGTESGMAGVESYLHRQLVWFNHA
jgi:acyl-CoA reductase-like NAD-dependent aldehyde dehydrogenase